MENPRVKPAGRGQYFQNPRKVKSKKYIRLGRQPFATKGVVGCVDWEVLPAAWKAGRRVGIAGSVIIRPGNNAISTLKLNWGVIPLYLQTKICNYIIVVHREVILDVCKPS